jgi:uncharacterized protein (DUF849 family)
MTNTPGMLRAMGGMMTEIGVKPEIEAFDTGHLWFAKELVKEGVLESRMRWYSSVWVFPGARPTISTPSWRWSTMCPPTGPGRPSRWGATRWPFVAAAVLAGGNVRVGFEDNLFLGKGQLATNAQLVERAVTIVENHGRAGDRTCRTCVNDWT